MTTSVMKCFFATVGVVLFASVCPVSAQTQPVVVSENRAYFFGGREPIVPARILYTSASPNGRYLLATHLSPRTETFQWVLTPPDPTQTLTVTLTLYDARRNRATVLWKTSGNTTEFTTPVGFSWLSSGETAVVRLIHSKQVPSLQNVDTPGLSREQPRMEMGVSLLYVNAPRETVRRWDVGGTTNAIFGVSPSPTRNEALVTSSVDKDSYELRFLTGAGTLQAPISLPVRSFTVKGWSADGDRAELSAATVNSENKREFITYVWKRSTRTLQRVDTPDKDITYQTDDEATETKRRADLPVHISAGQAVVSVEQTKRESPCVLVTSKDGKEQYLLATDAKPVTILESGGRLTVIYESGSALYAVPVYPAPYSTYVTLLRREVEANAMQVASAIGQWMLDNKVESLPASFDPIVELVGDGKSKYMKRDTPFRDPKTGAMIFKNVYTGKPDATKNNPLFTLQHPFGKLTMYADGDNFVWDPAEPAAKP
jgi:hypothetical protein